jgi:hypothetical protein
MKAILTRLNARSNHATNAHVNAGLKTLPKSPFPENYAYPEVVREDNLANPTMHANPPLKSPFPS